MHKNEYTFARPTYLQPTAPSKRVIKSPKRVNTLPASLTSLVGRSEELQTLHDLLSQHRLITLVGPGGVGKTRLAIAAAAQAQPHFQNGVCFVPLAAVSTTELMISSIASALDFTFYSHEAPLMQLCNYLRGKQMLLLLDNFEQLMAAVAVLSTLLEQVPDITLLVTSRERLNCYGEQVFVVNTLPFPVHEAEQVTDTHSAVHLFVQRAQGVCPGFNLTADNQASIVDICRLVGGLPLALELAAPWVRLLSCTEIAQELASNLNFLSATLTGVPERHHTLQVVFAHSWQRLTVAEQDAFRALTIFPGSFTRAAAESITEITLPVLASLLDKSFLSRQTSERFTIHSVLREYGREELRQAQVHNMYADRHSAYYLDFLQQQEMSLLGKDKRQAQQQIEAEMDNVHQAWGWAVTQQQTDRIQRSVHVLFRFCEYQYRQQEGIALFTQALQGLPLGHIALQKAVIQQMQIRLGALYNHLCQYELAQHWLQEGLQMAQALGDDQEVAFALSDLARLSINQQNYQEASEKGRQALALYKQLGNQMGVAENLLYLGYLAQSCGDFDEAYAYYESTWALAQQSHNSILKASCLREMAGIASKYYHNHIQAITYLDQALSICDSTGLSLGKGHILNMLAEVYLERGEYLAARNCCEQALRIGKDLGIEIVEKWALLDINVTHIYCHNYAAVQSYLNPIAPITGAAGEQAAEIHKSLGTVFALQGDYTSAHIHLAQALQISQQIHHSGYEATTLASFGLLAYHQQQYQQAQTYCEQALHIAQPLRRHSIQREALTYLGHALVKMEQWTEAVAAYQQAIDLAQNLAPHLALEPRAGLAAALFGSGKRTQARAQVAEVVQILGLDEVLEDYVPLNVYWHSYRILAAAQDPQAGEMLQTAHHLLQERAEHTSSAQLKRTFLQISLHRDIATAWAQATSLQSKPDANLVVDAPEMIQLLSQRELEVLQLIAAGYRNQEIAVELVVTLGTVKSHTAAIYRKLDVQNRTQAVARARELGLLT